MAAWNELPKERLDALFGENKKRYDELAALGLKLDLSRGKPGPDVLDLSNGLLGALEDWRAEDGTDVRNYGVVTGLPELKNLFAELLGVSAERMIVGGNSSLTHMYNSFAMLYQFGAPDGMGGMDSKPWQKADAVKILCPVPGYDRHFGAASDFGAELVPVPMESDGPDMDEVERLASSDPAVKGIWVIPVYSNPTGCVISEEKARRLAQMRAAAPDFRIFWDNAYGVHHLWGENSAPDIFALCGEAGYPERVLYYFSTSKINFPGGGVGMVAAGPRTVERMTAHIKMQTIGFDKISQLRTVRFFGGKAENVSAHMGKIAEVLRPKFELVMDRLDSEFSGTGLVSYERPKGGYFISVDVPDGCAKRVVALAKEAGAVLTPAGATFPYGKDPRDSNIRLAPTFPSLEELGSTMDLFAVCVKLAALEKWLGV
ncbi:MAG: aminotransferase class I/II-fold pyridoxal phosphate-dependent enzyme [Clostridiales Family XIII bacterium]|jgi:aspartate/methionine/tyrosine aminotransferase|nr:aminotransferase class I/II-fold pyridoxal phosphate-dependent enzyme [Clostridiales Family XIII bacterium]